MTIRQSSNELAPRLTLHLVLLAAGTFVLGVDGFVLPGLLPAVARDLDVTVATAGQLTTAFAVTYALSSPVIAAVTGRLDRRIVLGGGMAVFLLGMIAQATGPSFPVVLAGRILAGVGAAAFQANAYAVAGVLSPPGRRARSLAVIGAGASVATVVGVPLGVFVGQAVGWRGAMWLIAALATVAAAFTATLPPVRLPSATLRERIGLFTSPRLLTLLLVSALVLIPMYAVVSYVAPLVGGQGQGSPAVLVTLLAFGAAFLTGNRVVGRLADRFGPVPITVIGLAVSVCALLGLWAARPDLVPTVAAISALGLVGSFLVIPQQSRVFAAGGDSATVALGLNGSMLYVGTAVGAALGGAVIASAGLDWLAPCAAIVAALALTVTLATGSRPSVANQTSGAVPPAHGGA